MVRKPRAPAMSKEAMRQESERLVREAMARNVTITQGKTRLDVKCSKCGAPNRVSAEVDHGRVEYACKECGHKQKTLGPEDRWVFGHCGRDNVGREDVARPTCTKAACGRRSWMSSAGLDCVKTKSDLLITPSEGRIFAFFALSVTISLKILGAVIPRRVFTQPGPSSAVTRGPQ